MTIGFGRDDKTNDGMLLLLPFHGQLLCSQASPTKSNVLFPLALCRPTLLPARPGEEHVHLFTDRRRFVSPIIHLGGGPLVGGNVPWTVGVGSY